MTTSLLVRSWTYLALRGGVAVIFGLVAIAAPLRTAATLATLWGLWALSDAVGSLCQAYQHPSSRARWFLVAIGVLALAVAFLAVLRFGLDATTVLRLLGVWLIVRGTLEVFQALGTGDGSGLGLLGSAAVGVVVGVLFLLAPGETAVGAAGILGVSVLVWGVALCGLALWVRRSDSDSRTSPQR